MGSVSVLARRGVERAGSARHLQRSRDIPKAQRSPSAIDKQTRGTTPDGLPVHSFQSLLADLATLVRNTVTTANVNSHEFILLTTPTAIQQKALNLLGIKSLHRTQ